MYPDNFFDLIHSRHLAQSIKDWEAYIRRIYRCAPPPPPARLLTPPAARHTKPGGFVELQEFNLGELHADDGSYTPATAVHRWLRHFVAAAALAGMPDPCARFEGWVRAAGFVDVAVTRFKTPWAVWDNLTEPKLREVGRLIRLNSVSGFEAYGLALFYRYSGLSPEDGRRICDEATQELMEGNVHVYTHQ